MIIFTIFFFVGLLLIPVIAFSLIPKNYDGSKTLFVILISILLSMIYILVAYMIGYIG